MSLPDRVSAFFAPDGPLAATIDGFESREGQARLARTVAEIFEHGGTLVAEAGTGIGKTLAYLVPAAMVGRRVLVSTGTRTLQDQIFYKDLPVLARALGRDLRTAYMKGRTNYLCLHRCDRLGEAEAGLPVDDRRRLAQIREWAADTDTGDRSEIDDLPDHFPLWQELSATSEQCLGRDCVRYHDCFITRMRQRADDAEIVVVNHHLLCADAAVRQGEYGEVIPACDILVIDEAHQLEDVVTQYFGVAVSTHRLEEFTRDAMAAVAAVPADRGRSAVRLSLAIADAQYAARALFDETRQEGTARDAGDRVVITPDLADRLTPAVMRLAEALDAIGAEVASTAGPRPSGGDAPEPEDAPGAGGAIARLDRRDPRDRRAGERHPRGLDPRHDGGRSPLRPLRGTAGTRRVAAGGAD